MLIWTPANYWSLKSLIKEHFNVSLSFCFNGDETPRFIDKGLRWRFSPRVRLAPFSTLMCFKIKFACGYYQTLLETLITEREGKTLWVTEHKQSGSSVLFCCKQCHKAIKCFQTKKKKKRFLSLIEQNTLYYAV